MNRAKIHIQQTAEFAWKIDRYAGVNRPLLVKGGKDKAERTDIAAGAPRSKSFKTRRFW
jgi:hypothetical protein